MPLNDPAVAAPTSKPIFSPKPVLYFKPGAINSRCSVRGPTYRPSLLGVSRDICGSFSTLHLAIAFESATSQHNFLAMDLGHTPIGLSDFDATNAAIILSQQLLCLCLPHDRHIVEFSDRVEQSVDNCVTAALSNGSNRMCKRSLTEQTSGNTKCWS